MIPFFFFDDFTKYRRQSQLIERRDLRLQLPHLNRVPAILLEDIDAKSREIFDRVAAVAGAADGEFHFEPFASVYDMAGELFDEQRSEDRTRPIEGEFVQTAMGLYERRFARDKK
jgi:hypothetical protein